MQSEFMFMLKQMFFRAGCVACVVLLLAGCNVSPLNVYADNAQDIPPPPLMTRQPRLLTVPDDLRLPRATAKEASATPTPSPATAPVAAAAPSPAAAPVAAPAPAAVASPAAAPSAPVAPAPAATPPAPVATTAPSAPPVVAANAAAPVTLFAPYMPSAVETAPPKKWETLPSHDLPWVTGALPTRTNEETTMGVGQRLFGRLFAQVAFGSAQARLAFPKSDNPAAAQVQCETVTCLDAARDMLLKDAQDKGWRVLLNRRVSLHQSFQFQRDDRVVWVEVNVTGKNTLEMEYNLMPRQQ